MALLHNTSAHQLFGHILSVTIGGGETGFMVYNNSCNLKRAVANKNRRILAKNVAALCCKDVETF